MNLKKAKERNRASQYNPYEEPQSRLDEVNKDTRLNQSAKASYEAIVKTVKVFPDHDFSCRRIALEIGLHRNTVQAAVNKLIDCGYLERKRLESRRVRYRLTPFRIGEVAAIKSLEHAYGDIAFRCDQATFGDVFKNVSARYPKLSRLQVADLIQAFVKDCKDAEMKTTMTALTKWINVALPIYADKYAM